MSDGLREQAKWLLDHWTEPAFARPPMQEKALALARTVLAVECLDYQLQTLGRAESADREALEDAVERLNAQHVAIYVDYRAVWVVTCTPQPQDCGPLT